MLETSRARLLDLLGPDDVVLDVGGWADPFERADWVIDLMPYETRGLYERNGWVSPRSATERFSARTWVQRDLCDREPYPFADKAIDFAICSQTLEDLRDPLWACSELIRIARAGYIEVPSRLEEQSWGVNGPFVGWSHHRWLIDIAGDDLRFVPKLHEMHARREWHFPQGFWRTLDEEERVLALWWDGSFAFHEQIFFNAEEADRYLRTFVHRELMTRGRSRVNYAAAMVVRRLAARARKAGRRDRSRL